MVSGQIYRKILGDIVIISGFYCVRVMTIVVK